MYEIEIILHTDEEPTVQDVLDYINELGDDLHFTVKARAAAARFAGRRLTCI